MKKLFLLVFICASGKFSYAQPTLQQELYYTCKVWGFVKYYHSEVSTCHVDWDSVLVHVLPLVESAATSADFNDALDTMLLAAGPMALATAPPPVITDPLLKCNLDWNWTGASIFRSDVQAQLDTIKNNFRPHAGCYVAPGDYTKTLYDDWGGWLQFPHDTVLLATNIHTSYPDEDHRLLMLFKYWNIIRYFNPYNYVLDIPWDTTLYNNVVPVANVSTPLGLSNLYMKIFTALNDAHVYGLSYDGYEGVPPGYYKPNIRLGYMGGQYIVLMSLEAGIYPGDALISVDGLTPAQWEDSLRPYYSSGNLSVFRRTMSSNILSRQSAGITENIVIADSTGTNHSFTLVCKNPSSYTSFFSPWFYPNDSLNAINWTTMECGVGYMNVGNITTPGTDSAYYALNDAPAIIVDIRNYPIDNAAFEMGALMYAGPTEFSKLTEPDLTFPGTYTWYHDFLGVSGNATPYKGKLIVLVDEQTQSSAEFSTMILKAVPGAVVIGSQTAGADGNITWLHPSYDMRAGWTSLGVYYPNGDSTQRIGIVPDSVVYPTAEGIRHHNDEVLNKALEMACTAASVPKVQINKTTVCVFPNPVTNVVSVETKNIHTDYVTVIITDVTGRVLMQQQCGAAQGNVFTSFDIRSLASGLYFLTVKTEMEQYVTKIIKE